MRLPVFRPSSDPHAQPLRSRLAAFLLSLAMVSLMLLALLSMGALGPGEKQDGSRLVSVNIAAQQSATTHQQHKSASAAKASSPEKEPQPVPPQPVPTQAPPPAFIHLSHSDFAAADISRLPRHDQASANDGSSRGNAAAYGPGEGPGGAHLYNAQWYREPTHAELATYLPKGAPPGSWGVIACRTIDHFHVENCAELDESPPGSGLARALRRASWQFLVRPPRIDGKVLVGSWVRIRFDFTRPAENAAAAGGAGEDGSP